MRWRHLHHQRVSRGAALALAASAPFGFFTRPNSASHETLVEATAENEDSSHQSKRIITQQWTLQGDHSSAIHSVSVDLPGLTVLQIDNDNTTTNDATSSRDHLGVVEVAADSPELLSCIDVESLPPTELQIRFRREAVACRALKGRLLTSLTLSRAQQVNTLEMDGGGTVVVRDGVMVADAPRSRLSIALAGGGDAQVSIQDPVHVRSLSLAESGAGLLQFLASGGLQIEQCARLSVVSSGLLHAFTPRIQTPLLRLNVFGKGNVALKTETERDDSIDVGKIKHRIVGADGGIRVFGRGTARVHRAFILGGGTIDVRDIVSEDVSMEACGEATMTTRVAPDAKTKTCGFGGKLETSIDESSITEKPSAEESSSLPAESEHQQPLECRAFPTDEQLVASALFGSDATVVKHAKEDALPLDMVKLIAEF